MINLLLHVRSNLVILRLNVISYIIKSCDIHVGLYDVLFWQFMGFSSPSPHRFWHATSSLTWVLSPHPLPTALSTTWVLLWRLQFGQINNRKDNTHSHSITHFFDRADCHPGWQKGGTHYPGWWHCQIQNWSGCGVVLFLPFCIFENVKLWDPILLSKHT